MLPGGVTAPDDHTPWAAATPTRMAERDGGARSLSLGRVLLLGLVVCGRHPVSGAPGNAGAAPCSPG